ncbi:porin family protein [Flavobacterium humi]|nr:porin family protein [Flavobacterium humi]
MEKLKKAWSAEKTNQPGLERKPKSLFSDFTGFGLKSLLQLFDKVPEMLNGSTIKNTVAVVLFSLMIGFTQTAMAQEPNPEQCQVRFGVKGGVNFSNMYTDDVDDENVLTGFHVGVFAKMQFNDNIALQPELLYTTKGSELTYNNAFAEGTAKFRLNYIEAPVLLVVNLTDNLNVHAGPYFAYLIDGKATNDSDANFFDSEEELDNDDFNKFDFGLSAGLGFDFDSFSVGARYNYGLTTVGKDRDFGGTTYTFPDGKNSAINVYAAFSF